jgi:hypothetical protein
MVSPAYGLFAEVKSAVRPALRNGSPLSVLTTSFMARRQATCS